MQSYSKRLNHFSHSHPLDLIDACWNHTDPPLCSGCKTRVSGWTYKCSRGCNFFIHAWCALNPRLIIHPSHFYSRHRLTLLATPAHPSGFFKCDGCGYHGDSFSYRCTTPGCDFNLHMVCASRPLETTHSSHSHPLSLTFRPPYQNGAFSCDICSQASSSRWLYRCASCNFDAHLDCVAAANESAHPSSSSAWHANGPPGTVYSPPTTAQVATDLAGGAAEGVVESAAQQGAQSIIQDMTGSDETSLDAAGDTFSMFDIF